LQIVIFSARPDERPPFEEANRRHGHELRYLDVRLTAATASLADGAPAACAFVTDRVDAAALERLAAGGVRLLLLRSAGTNHVDLEAAERLGVTVLRVPAYSPDAIAEHAFALLLALVRRIPQAYNRVRDGNFSVDGLVGWNLAGKTFGVVGTGRIGAAVARIAHGFGCRVLGFDARPDPAVSAAAQLRYVGLDELLGESDVVSLHLPLAAGSHHVIDARAIGLMRAGAILVNTGRGGLVDTSALIEALRTRKLGGAALDVYEGEDEVFFRDLSGEVIQDDALVRLLSFPHVIVSAHQAFLTREALAGIAETTLANATAYDAGRVPPEVQVVRGGPTPARP
jgi:D-lactate dehydrogenase